MPATELLPQTLPVPMVNGLKWLLPEIELLLQRIRSQLDQQQELDPAERNLAPVTDDLRQIEGALVMIDCTGGCILVSEILETLPAAAGRAGHDAEAAMAAISGATLQLADYLDWLQNGQADRAAVLQPVISELRLASGRPALLEADVFVRQMLLCGAMLPRPRGGEGRAAIAAHKLLPPFQALLLQWIKGVEVAATLHKLRKCADQIAHYAHEPAIVLLWSAFAAAVDSLLAVPEAESLELKRLMSRASLALKQLAEQGEVAAANAAPELAWRLLAHAAVIDTSGARWQALKAALPLDDALPLQPALTEVRRRLRGPNTHLLETVAGEVRRELASVKDSLDLAMRAGGLGADELQALRDRLQRIGQTLSVLGLAPLETLLGRQAQALDGLQATGAGRDAEWLRIATALLRVEHSLEQALFQPLRHTSQGAADDVSPDGFPHGRDLQQSRVVLLREMLVDTARLKAGIGAFLKAGTPPDTQEPVALLADIGLALRIIEAPPVADAVRDLKNWLAQAGLDVLRHDDHCATAFAQVIATLELYLEARRDELPRAALLEQWLIQSVAALPDVATLSGLRVDVPASAGTAEYASALEEPRWQDTLVMSPPVPLAPARPFDPVPEPISVPAAEPVIGSTGGGIDPEIRNIFIEEAQEVLDGLRRRLPALRRDLHDAEALDEIRRAFHTLKGSGRMVGAVRVGAFAWAVEHLLNRCIEGALPTNQAVVDLVGDALGLLPGLMDDFAQAIEREGSQDPARKVVERAEFLASGRAPEMVEAEVLAVFRADALDRLADIERHLLADDALPVDAESIRALHTLKGSAAIVNAQGLSEVAAALEALLRRLRQDHHPLPPEVRALVSELLPMLREWAAGRADDALTAPDWLARIEALKPFLPAVGDGAGTAGRHESAANLCFDRLHAIEALLRVWATQPDDAGLVVRIAEAADALAEAGADCLPLARAAAALAARLRQPETGAPDATFLEALHGVIERGYQYLDSFREGRLPETGQELVDRIAGLAWSGVAPPSAATLTAVPQQTIPLQAATVLHDEPASPLAASLAWPTAGETGADAELQAIFLEEAEQLVAVLQRGFDEWPAQTTSGWEMSHELVRAAHTLAGSARLCGYRALGDAAQVLEQALQRQDGSPATAEAARAALADALAVFDAALVTLRVAAEPLPAHDAEAGFFTSIPGLDANTPADVNVDVDLAPAWAPTPASALASEPPSQPLSELLSQPATEIFTAQPLPLSLPDAADEELVNIFIAESSENLETITSHLRFWQSGDDTATAELQRALHTLKGGARLSGFMAMGDLTHELESRVVSLLARGEKPVGIEQQRLSLMLDGLMRMHDALSRRQYSHNLAQGIGETVEQQVEALREATPAASEAWTRPPEPLLTPEAVPEEAQADLEGLTEDGFSRALFWQPAEDEAATLARRELARVPVERLDAMLNEAGEISIYRARLEQQNAALVGQLGEMAQTIARLREQLRLMELETEAQIAARGFSAQDALGQVQHDFDPLEMDRYTRMQELSRALAEAVSDLASLKQGMDVGVNEAQGLLLQQGRINTSVQQGLMGTLMVPFSRQVPRLQRVVRQTALEEGKQVELAFEGVESELDRNVLEAMTAPLEHLLRNAVVHGIEPPAERHVRGKSETGQIRVLLRREGTLLNLEIVDDGAGLNFEAIRRKAVERGLMPQGLELADDEVARFIFESGFSTAARLTQNAGRGVGMDVVASEIKQLGGVLELRSETGRGMRFIVRLPLTLALSQALIVGLGEETYALPLPAIEGIARIPRTVASQLAGDEPVYYGYGGQDYRIRSLAELLDLPYEVPEDTRSVLAVLVRLGEGIGGERRVALLVDRLLGNREIVSKAVGPQLSSISGVAGATIVSSGEVVLILDPAALVIDRARRRLIAEANVAREVLEKQYEQLGRLVMVVDDSITMRRVAERLLVRNGYRVITAKDGIDAMAELQHESPAVILLDIEMPRADGFEVASFVRADERIRDTPIIMITSRSGDKHRARAAALGVERYLIKPYQEDELLDEIRALLQWREAAAA